MISIFMKYINRYILKNLLIEQKREVHTTYKGVPIICNFQYFHCQAQLFNLQPALAVDFSYFYSSYFKALVIVFHSLTELVIII